MRNAAKAVLMCFLLMMSAGCGKKGGGNNSSADDTTEASAAMTTVSEVTTSKTVTAAAASTTKKTVTTAVTTTAEAVTETTSSVTDTSVTTEAASNTVNVPDTGCAEAAAAFYQAYLEHDPEKVYGMFADQEREGYNEVVRSELEGKDPKEVFRRAALIKAIGSSMDNISEIMDYYSDGEDDKWTFMIPDGELTEVDSEQLAEFNKSLGTAFTKAYTCQYMFYKDETNDKSFTGNSSAFVELNGKWYLSYSSVMGTDLINFMDFE